MKIVPHNERSELLVRAVCSAVEKMADGLLLCKEGDLQKDTVQDLSGLQEFLAKVLTANRESMDNELYNCPNSNCKVVKWLKTSALPKKKLCSEGITDINGNKGCGRKRTNWTLATVWR